MKVLIVSSKYLPEYSGSGLRAHNTYMRLSKKFDVNFQVITSSTGNYKSKTYEINGIQIQRIISRKIRIINKIFGKSIFKRLLNALVIIFEYRNVKKEIKNKKFDLIHTFGISPATIAAINFSRNNKIPLIMEIVNPVKTPYQFLPLQKYISKYDLSKSCIIVAISKSIGIMCNNYNLKDNVWIRPNPIDEKRFNVPTLDSKYKSRRKLSDFNSEDIVLVYVAKYLKRKNHTFLLDVMSKLPEKYKLILAGPLLEKNDLVNGYKIDNFYKLEQKAKDLRIEKRVKISHGFVDMKDYLISADISCFPSYNEAMGTPLLESIACGVPVIANKDEKSFQEWINNHENGYLEILDSEKWSTRIQELSNKITKEKQVNMSKKIKKISSSGKIDLDYYKIIKKLHNSKNEKPNIMEILTDD
ncbi:MAG: hypothetical protein CL748_04685 [Chloroflexi bacterium]|nr:hypothetical protein [Chloroflexota bacterium]